MKDLSRLIIAGAVIIAACLLLTACETTKEKEVNLGFQATALVVEATPSDPSTGTGVAGKVAFGDTAGFFNDRPQSKHSMYGYHWLSYAWIPALWGSNQVSSEVIVFTYGGDADNPQTDVQAKAQMENYLGLALSPKIQTVIKTLTPSGSKTVTADQDGNTTVKTEPTPTK